MEIQNGLVAELDTPLDFVAPTDHSENFATHLICTIGDPEFDTEQCRATCAGDLDQQAMLKHGCVYKRPPMHLTNQALSAL